MCEIHMVNNYSSYGFTTQPNSERSMEVWLLEYQCSKNEDPIIIMLAKASSRYLKDGQQKIKKQHYFDY